MTAYEHPGNASVRTSALRIAVVQGALPDDWRAVQERLDGAVEGSLGFCLNLSAGAATFAAVVATGWTLVHMLSAAVPSMSVFVLCGAVAVPALLAGLAAGHWAGNMFLRLFLRLDDATRRGFAARLTLARCPAHWPACMRRWLFTGDWLGAPSYDLRFPYARVFIEGEAPPTCRGEDMLWREIHCALSGDGLWEAGANFREISYPSRLPSWATCVEKGDGFGELRERIGREEASEWVQHLWRRACRQWPSLAVSDYPEQARRECFEMHSLVLAGGRVALVVVLRPTSFVLELEMEEEDRDAA